jgi:hypothetical protein
MLVQRLRYLMHRLSYHSAFTSTHSSHSSVMSTMVTMMRFPDEILFRVALDNASSHVRIQLSHACSIGTR